MPVHPQAGISTNYKACGVSSVSFVEMLNAYTRKTHAYLVRQIDLENITGQAVVLDLLPLSITVGQQLHRGPSV
jgi:hypothetical protein